MARLAFPPTISRLASGIAKPASRRAPIQSAASRTTKASPVARPSLSLSAASKTTSLRVASAALQVSRSARVSAVASRSNSGACIRALRDATVVRKQMTDSEQMKKTKTKKTQIPRPKTTIAAASKWAKTRQYTTVVPKTAVKNMKKCQEKTKTEYEELSEGDTVIEIDNNPELLNDVSFDENLEPSQQSSLPGGFARFETLMTTRFQGLRVAQRPVYGGADFFILGRKRPRITETEDVEHVESVSKIPRKAETTLKFGKIKKDTSTLTSAKQDLTKTFNCFGFTIKSPALPQMKAESRFALDIELLLPDIIKTNEGQARPDSTFNVASELITGVVTVSVPTRKAVRFDQTIKRRLYDFDAPSKEAKIPLEKRDWEPQKNNVAYPRSSVPTSFKNMFQSTSLQSIALKHRVLHRFKAVQEYEKRRRQDAIATGDESPPLHQLDYGNAEYKLALQPKRVITVDDIGTFVDPRTLGIPTSTYNDGPLLHFGGFQDEFGRVFENAYISEKAAAYKAPISWDDAPESTYALNRWTNSVFSCMQPADFEHEQRD